MSDIPEPSDTGSLGTQITSESSSAISQPESPMAGLPIVQTLDGLAATRSRSMGGEVAATLISGCFNQLEHELSVTKKELADSRMQLDDVKEILTTVRIENARIRGEIDSLNNEKTIRNVCLLAGTAIAGFGLDLCNKSQTTLGGTLIGIGVILCLVGWFSIGRRVTK